MAIREKDVEATSVAKLAQKKWRSSGLTDAQAKALCLLPLAGTAVAKLAANLQATGALKIPYWALDGHPTDFYRVRYLEKLTGFAGTLEKPQRYDQPAGTLNEVYYPPLLKDSWSVVAADPTRPVCITEGELKAAAGCAAGIATMGLGGVSVFKSSKRGISFLPSLEEIQWTGRRAYVVFDNDIVAKPEVLRAQHSLADELIQRGALVFFVALPAGPAKGLDDFLLAKGVESFAELLDSASPSGESAALWEMNSELIYLRGINRVLERETVLLMKPGDFTASTYANRFYLEHIEKGRNGKTAVSVVKTPAAPRWLRWEQRSELDNLTYAPGKAKVVGKLWNAWRGWGCEPKPGNVDPWLWLMDFLFQGDAPARQYYERWCAYPLQHPGAKLLTAVVLWSVVKRLGKSMAGISLAKIYGDNAVIVDSKQLKGGFNTWAKNRQLIIGEEITAGEARVDADYLKGIITNPYVTINEKFQPEYTVPNCTNFQFFSNHPDALFLEDGDQRYFIHEVRQPAPAPRKLYEAADTWLHGDGPSHLFDYLLKLDMGDFNPREHAPMTRSKEDMTLAGKSDIALWVVKLQENPAQTLKPLGAKAAAECDMFTAAQLYRAFDPERRGRSSENALGRALTAAGLRRVNGDLPVWCSVGTQRLYAIRNQEKWHAATRTELRKHYDKFFGADALGDVT